MSAALPPSPVCPTCSTTTTAIPGPAGADGADGAAGTNGLNAYTTTTLAFTVPAVAATVVVQVVASGWASILQYVFVSNAGHYQVTAKPTSTSITLKNLGYTGNAIPAAIVGPGQSISPAGIKGTDGAAGSTDINDVSPTTNKGDIIVDNGTNTPNASAVRLGVGANGTRPIADNTQPTGLKYSKVDLADSTQITGVLPTANGGTGTATDPFPGSSTDNAVVRFDGVGGHKVQNTSTLTVTDAGTVQTTGGNARGTEAVDLQATRSGVTMVASANYSVVGGGRDNKASGLYSVVPGGYTASAEGQGSFAAGEVCRAVGNYSVATGKDALAPDYGMRSHCAGKYSTFGDNAYGDWSSKATTTNATPTVMYLDAISAVIGPYVGSSMLYELLVLGRRNNGDTAAWRFIGCLKNDGGATTDVGAVAGSLLGADAGCSATWGVLGSVVVGADAGTSTLMITVTGTLGNTIRWMAVGRFLALLH